MPDKARELAEVIKTTREFVELKQARSLIEKTANLKDIVVEFNKRQMELYSGRLSAGQAQEKSAQLGKMYENISKVPEIDRFLKALKQFNDMLSGIMKTVNDSLDTEIRLR